MIKITFWPDLEKIEQEIIYGGKSRKVSHFMTKSAMRVYEKEVKKYFKEYLKDLKMEFSSEWKYGA